MSVLANTIMMSGILTATVIPALAATDERAQPDNFVVWMFLGLCALIIVAQVLPMIWSARKHARLAADLAKKSAQTQLN
jgi:hypothetical protein